MGWVTQTFDILSDCGAPVWPWTDEGGGEFWSSCWGYRRLVQADKGNADPSNRLQIWTSHCRAQRMQPAATARRDRPALPTTPRSGVPGRWPQHTAGTHGHSCNPAITAATHRAQLPPTGRAAPASAPGYLPKARLLRCLIWIVRLGSSQLSKWWSKWLFA